MRQQPQVLLRNALLAVLALDLVLIGTSVRSYPPLLALPGGGLYVAEPVVLLLAYAAIVLAATRHPGTGRQKAVHIGTRVGIIAGLLWIVNLASETFLDLSGVPNILTTAPFLLGGFVLWGLAAFLSARRTASISLGVLAAVWAAMIGVLMTVTFGFLLGLAALPRLEYLLAGDADFARSGWQDLHAFALANQFDSGFSHLLGGLVIGAIVGTIGAAAGSRAGRARAPLLAP